MVVGWVAAARGAKTAALDLSTGRIYIPFVEFQEPSGSTRRQAIKRSFPVLVIGQAK